MLLDEVEMLGKTDSDSYKELLATLNAGFEAGRDVPRQEKGPDGNYQERRFEVYCPRALAGINKLAETLEDRGTMLVMQRKLRREKTARFSPRKLQNEVQSLRDRCYQWALTHAADLAQTYDQADTIFTSYLDSLDDRARDLWEPLVSIVALADVERSDGQKTLTDELTALAFDLCQVRDGVAEDSTVVQVVKALQQIVAQHRATGLFESGAELTLPPIELAGVRKEHLGWEKLSTKTLASLLNPLGLFSKNTRRGGKVSLAYHLSAKDLAELSERYAQGSAPEDEKK